MPAGEPCEAESPGDAEHQQAKLFEHALLRVACWPVETLEPFGSPDLATAASRVSALTETILARAPALESAIHDAVPTIPQRDLRAMLLSLRRRLHDGSEPLPLPGAVTASRLKSTVPHVWRCIEEEAGRRVALAQARDAFDALHAAELRRQRLHLHRVASGLPFRRALAVGNPVLAARWRPIDRVAALSDRARLRRLEASVFHTLMRAVGRPTPQGAWAGVTSVRPTGQGQPPGSTRLKISACVWQRHFTVDLAPFDAALAALRSDPRYRACPLRLNPTARRVPTGWRFERHVHPEMGWCSAPHNPACDLLIHAYSQRPPSTAGAVIGELAGSNMELADELFQAVDHLLAEDVLRVDIAIPAASETVWMALDAVTPKLLPEDRIPWSSAVEQARGVCRDLATYFDELEPAEIGRMREAVESAVRSLWDWVGLHGEPRQPILHLDTCVPFEVRWDQSAREKLAQAVHAVLSFHRADGAAERYRRTSLRAVAEAVAAADDSRLLALVDGTGFRRIPPAGRDMDLHEAIFARFTGIPSADVVAHCRQWERHLEPVANDSSVTLDVHEGADHPPPGPAGAFILSALNGDNVVVDWGRPQPGMFVARLADAIAARDGQVPLISELQRRLAAVEAHGVVPAEIVGSDPIDPNTALQPRVAPLRLEAHGANGGGLDGVTLELDPDALRPWLRGRANERIVPTYHSAAAIGGVDPCSWLLFRLAMGHGWEFTSFGFPPLRRERATWHHLPRLVLPGGTILSAERWTVPAEALRAIQRCDGPNRYLAWRAEVEQRGLPSLVRVRWDPHPAASTILMRTDSPLAVDALFLRLPETSPRLIVTEIPGGVAWNCVRSPTGKHHFAELAVSWYDDSYWNAIGREASP